MQGRSEARCQEISIDVFNSKASFPKNTLPGWTDVQNWGESKDMGWGGVFHLSKASD